MLVVKTSVVVMPLLSVATRIGRDYSTCPCRSRFVHTHFRKLPLADVVRYFDEIMFHHQDLFTSFFTRE
jgi:hypothetical protein